MDRPLTSLVHRMAWGPVQNPIRCLLHGQAALVSLGLAVYFATAGVIGTRSERFTLVVFALSQLALFAVSALYHGVSWRPLWKCRMQRVDHSMIYVKIAGTLTPIAWLALTDPARWAVLGGVWGIAAAGVAQKAFFPDLPEKASIPLQVFQAALGIPAMLALGERYPNPAVGLAVSGATLYAIGLVVFLTQRPRLWPRVFSHHEVFHVLVVAGSVAYYALALRYLAST